MLFGIVILLLAAGIAFYHYVQGLFSSLVSATLVVLSALLAVSFHEVVAQRLLGTSFPTYAHAVALAGLFALCYVLLRLITDRVVPGNVRFPVMVDKVGAGVFGFIAGVFAAGILAITAQLLPMGPSIAGYSRFALADREVTGVKIPGKYQRQDLVIVGELQDDTLQASRASSMFPLPADSMVLGLVSYVSNGGSLAGERPLDAVHPSYPDELFAHRLGPGYGSDVLIGDDSHPKLAVQTAYTSDRVLNDHRDFDIKEVRGEKAPQFVPEATQVPVVVRAVMDSPTGATANSFNMGSVRLVVAGRNYFPIGSLQRGQTLLLTRPDDYLFANAHAPVDFVFMVDADALPVKEGTEQLMLPRGSFIEAKRAARADLSEMSLKSSIPSDSANVGIVEKDPSTQR